MRYGNGRGATTAGDREGWYILEQRSKKKTPTPSYHMPINETFLLVQKNLYLKYIIVELPIIFKFCQKKHTTIYEHLSYTPIC